MIKNISLLRSLKTLGLAVTVLISAGCVSMERLVKVPAQLELATIGSYKTDIHRQSIHIFNPISLDNRVAKLRLEPRVENLFFLLDQSAALSEEFRGVSTRLYAREMVRRFTETMPKKNYSGALLLYHQQAKANKQALQLTSYTPADLRKALVEPGLMQLINRDSLPMAIDQLSELISRTEGSSAVILVTSWAKIDSRVERAVMRMRQSSRFVGGMQISGSGPEPTPWQGHQSGVCLYTIGVGNQLSRTRLETVDSCGYSIAANKVAQPRDMTHFVQRVLYKGPADSDGDGIYDYLDGCPNTSIGRIVDYFGCLRFAASEGVINK
jgi:OOP family OmpA-OmpF porin